MTYQGPGRESRKPYFEGWYFKLVAPSGHALALIPGVHHTTSSAAAFVQVIDGETGNTSYFPFSRESFQPEKKPFCVAVGRNTFSLEGLSIDLSDASTRVAGTVSFTGITAYPPFALTPGIMGPFSYVPGMECRHGVVSVDHTLNGSLEFQGQTIDFTGGRGYIEKDWGRSFPKSWVWLQTNRFTNAGDSFMLSLARIPYLGSWFPGFLGFLRYNGQWFRFGTYTGAKTSGSWSENGLELRVVSGSMVLDITALRASTGFLQAPVNGAMDRRIAESVNAEIRLRLTRKGRTEWMGIGLSAGMEMVGVPEDLGLD